MMTLVCSDESFSETLKASSAANCQDSMSVGHFQVVNYGPAGEDSNFFAYLNIDSCFWVQQHQVFDLSHSYL